MIVISISCDNGGSNLLARPAISVPQWQCSVPQWQCLAVMPSALRPRWDEAAVQWSAA